MPNDAYSQQALSADSRFRQRVKAAIAKVAFQVLNEAIIVPNHAERAAHARQQIADIEAAAARLAPSLVMRTNLLAFATSYDFQQGAVVTAASDADIESQLMTDWNHLAGI